MNILHSIKYHGLKWLRMGWYQVRYRFNEWKTIQGIAIPVQLDHGYSVLRFIDNGEYEQHELALLKKNLSPGDIVLELGTGIGFISAYCAKIIGSENVYSFEGNPEMEPLIKKLYSKNNVAPTLEIALLGEKNGESNFYINEDSFLASSGNVKNTLQERKIKERNLNEVIREIRPTYLVMDIEGGEYDILAIIDFQDIYKIQFELHPGLLTKEQVNFIFEKLAAARFIQAGEGKATNNYFFQREVTA